MCSSNAWRWLVPGPLCPLPHPKEIQEKIMKRYSGSPPSNGPGAKVLTVNGEAQTYTDDYRIFNVTASNTVSISGLTISNGRAAGASGAPGAVGQGGAILNAGSLTLTECAFSSNYAQGGSG